MSTFKVSIETIKEAKHHPNADKLDVCTLKSMNFQFVTGRDQFKSGDMVVYFPIDSVLPEKVISYLGLTGKLAGKNKDRIKTCRLRQEISEGIVSSKDIFNEFPISTELRTDFQILNCPDGFDVTECFGVTKYEPPVQITQQANLHALSGLGLSIYDIEGADRYTDVAELLMHIPVVVTEKLEGTNFACGIFENKFVVAQRTAFIEEVEGKEHFFWTVAREMKLEQKCFAIQEKHFQGKNFFLRGELIGEKIQGNIYELKGQTVKFFDLFVEGNYLSSIPFGNLMAEFELPEVPLIGWNVEGMRGILRLEGKTSIKELSNGPSRLNEKVLREGIVIKPFDEQRHPSIGRLLLKQRSPQYLANSDL